jgi:hypothetical protein
MKDDGVYTEPRGRYTPDSRGGHGAIATDGHAAEHITWPMHGQIQNTDGTVPL